MIGISIWELTRVTMRLCVEQGLHRADFPEHASLLHQQMRRRLFWLCYMIDRYSSVTLNRPFAIDDNDISIGLPVDANDCDLIAASADINNLDAYLVDRDPSIPSDMSVMIFCVRLRQITSRIQLQFTDLLATHQSPHQRQEDSIHLTGRVHNLLYVFMTELDIWRQSAPIIANPRSLCERQDFYDLLHAREVFHLVRRAVDVAPKCDSSPSKSLLVQCQMSAAKVIALYSTLYRDAVTACTRSYFQMMFAAGLSLLYCGSRLPQLDHSMADSCLDSLRQCKETLAQMVVELPDAKHYITIFDALHQNLLKKVDRLLGSSTERNHQQEAPSTGDNTFTNLDAHGSAGIMGGWTQPTGWMSGGVSMNEGIFPNQGLLPNHAGPGSTIMPAYLADNPELLQAYVMGSEGEQSVWHWDWLNDESMWNVGQYVVGDPTGLYGI